MTGSELSASTLWASRWNRGALNRVPSAGFRGSCCRFWGGAPRSICLIDRAKRVVHRSKIDFWSNFHQDPSRKCVSRCIDIRFKICLLIRSQPRSQSYSLEKQRWSWILVHVSVKEMKMFAYRRPCTESWHVISRKCLLIAIQYRHQVIAS